MEGVCTANKCMAGNCEGGHSPPGALEPKNKKKKNKMCFISLVISMADYCKDPGLIPIINVGNYLT